MIQQKLILLFIVYSLCFISEFYSVPCDIRLSVVVDNGEIENGSLIVNNSILYKEGEYFIDDNNQTRGCICNVRRCIRKCCQPDETLINNTCTASVHDLKINEIQFFGGNNNGSLNNYAFIYGNACDNGHLSSNFSITNSGLLKQEFFDDDDENEFSYHNVFEYCIDIDETDNRHLTSYICSPDEPEFEYSFPGIYHKTNQFLRVGFTIFCILSIFAYAVTPELRNFRGLCLMNQVACFYLCFVAILISTVFDDFPLGLREFFGYVFNSSYFAAVLWMTVIVFDIHQSFRTSTKIEIRHGDVNISYPNNNVKKFIIYSAFTCGASLLYSVTIYFIDNWYIKDGSSKPDINRLLFMTDFKETLVFFYGPLALILVIDVFLYVNLVKNRKMWKRRIIESLRNEGYDGRDFQEFTKSTVFDRIFILTGLLWLLEIIGFFVIHYNDITFLRFIKKIRFSTSNYNVKFFWWNGPVMFMTYLRSVFVVILVARESTLNSPYGKLHQPASTERFCSKL